MQARRHACDPVWTVRQCGMISPEPPGHIEDEEKVPAREKQDDKHKGCGCGHEHDTPEEEGVDSANDFMRKFLKKADPAKK